ncbi:unnamed protein product [Peniophora sp. CBMAI 1063]|nr:unnamed protein product [Peniophora sp. CBMAI 1063]
MAASPAIWGVDWKTGLPVTGPGAGCASATSLVEPRTFYSDPFTDVGDVVRPHSGPTHIDPCTTSPETTSPASAHTQTHNVTLIGFT